MRDRETQSLGAGRAGAEPVLVGGDPPGAGGSIFAALHRLLRGRYLWACLLGIAGGVCGGYLGWMSQSVLYRAEGLIYIAPSLPSPKDPGGQNVMPMYKAFVAGQVKLLESPSVTSAAMRHELWKEAGEGFSPEDYENFLKRRSIVHEGDGQHIQVFFTDDDPGVAQAGVRALVSAYERKAKETDPVAGRLQFAEDNAKIEEGRIKQGEAEILSLCAEYGGVEGLEMLLQAALRSVLRLDEEVARLRGVMRAEKPTVDGPAPYVPRSPREIALENPRMAADLLTLDLLEEQEQRKAQALGEENDELVALRQEIQVRRRHIDQFAEDYNKDRATKATGVAPGEDLKAREAALVEQLEGARAERKRLSQLRVDVRTLQMQVAESTRRLEGFNAQREESSAQQMSRGRVTLPIDIERPVAPFRDRRRSFAAFGSVFGAGLGVLIIILFGLADRRLRSTGDVSHALSRLRLLGLMPEFPADLFDPRGGEVAAHCVHQIRTLLQIRHTSARGACLSVTGPGVGSGKTTLTLALGLSFGHAGSPTVLVDADLTGRGLTRRIGQMLLAHARSVASTIAALPAEAGEGVAGASTSETVPVARAPRSAAKGKEEASRRLLAPLVHRGAGAEPTEPGELAALLTEALRRGGLRAVRKTGLLTDLFAICDLLFHGEGREELAACLGRAIGSDAAPAGEEVASIPLRIHELSAEHPEFNGVGMERYLYPTGLGTLRFLPLRGLGAAGGVSVSTLAGILERLRGEFEVTLVDTGPVPGAVEAPMVAAQADGVVLVVSPCDHRPDAERAVEYLEGVGAHLAGVVFNRAASREVLKASRSQSSAPAGDDIP